MPEMAESADEQRNDAVSLSVEPNFDHRDQAVLDVLQREDPETVSLYDLRNLYRQATDVRQKETLKQRIRYLTTEGPFEYEGSQTWRYLGE